jgi:AraC-like DNA-binding protein/mannose-6-phosphate isomerase-like protein (cupin superfamily)
MYSLEGKMREDILRVLSSLTDEELSLLDSSADGQRKLYSKPGRFIIERRTISNISTGEPTAPVCLHPHPRFCEFDKHSHDYVEIMYVCAGSVTHTIADESVRIDAGDLIIFGKSASHSIAAADIGDIGVNIVISTDLFENIVNTMHRDSSVNTRPLRTFMGKEQAYRVFRTSQSVEASNLLENMIFSYFVREQTDDYLLEQSIKLLFCYLCNISDGNVTQDDISYVESNKKKILKYIRTSYSTATLTECAYTLRLSPTYLSRWICANFGQSFKDLLMSERFSVACDLLATTSTPIGDIIIMVGYENSSHFHKEFKRRFGTTPLQYRKAHAVTGKENGVH